MSEYSKNSTLSFDGLLIYEGFKKVAESQQVIYDEVQNRGNSAHISLERVHGNLVCLDANVSKLTTRISNLELDWVRKTDISDLEDRIRDHITHKQNSAIASIVSSSSSLIAKELGSVQHTLGVVETKLAHVEQKITSMERSFIDELKEIKTSLEPISKMEQEISKINEKNKLFYVIPAGIVGIIWLIVSNWDSILSFLSSFLNVAITK